MSAKSQSGLEQLWDIEDEFSPLIGTAIGRVYPALSRKATSRTKRKLEKENSTNASLDRKHAELFSHSAQPSKLPSDTPPAHAKDNVVSEESADRDAIYHLCVTYWRPIFSFIYRRGYSAHDAQDLTQDFFLKLLQGDLLNHEDFAGGQFRARLLVLLRHFLINVRRKNKRRQSEEIQFISWEQGMADSPSAVLAPTLEAKYWTEERAFDVRWAATLAERGLLRLAEECATKGRRRVYDVLRKYLGADTSDIPYREISKILGVPETSSKALLHHLRVRYRSLLREEVGRTVEKETQVDDEIRYLCSALAGADRETDERVWNKWLTAQRKTFVATTAELWGKGRFSRVRVK